MTAEGDIVYLIARKAVKKRPGIREAWETKLIADMNRLQPRVSQGPAEKENKSSGRAVDC